MWSHRGRTVLALSMAGLFALSFAGFVAPATAATTTTATSSTLTDCPNFGAISTATAGNPGTGFSVTTSGTTSQTYSVTVPSNGNLIEICVYPNDGSTSTASSESTPVANWHAGTDCKGGGVTTCVYAERDIGTAAIDGPQTNLEVLDVTYTSAPTTELIALHVSQDSGSGICGASGVVTCFIFPTGGFPPSPTVLTSLSSVRVTVGGSVTDEAQVLGVSSTATGSVSFYYSTTDTCPNSGATQIGTSQSLTGPGSVASDSVQLNSAGFYYFYASYTPTGGATVYSVCEPLTVTLTSAPEFPLGVALVLLAALPPLLILRKRAVRLV